MIYLDNSATTFLSDISKERLNEGYLKFANPSSLHSAGLEAEKLIKKARDEIRNSLGIRNLSQYKAIFTSSGTEADNLAVLGTVRAKNFRFKPRIITTDSEHPAILNSFLRAEEEACEVVKLSTKGGKINEDEFLSSINERTVLISIMTVNNETGARYEVEKLFALAKRINPEVITHTDCVQGFLKMPFSLPSSNADLVTVSAHKIHAPKGVGALIVSENVVRAKRLVPIIYGGGQEDGFRSGTENVAGIYAFGGAASEGYSKIPEFVSNAEKLRKAFIGSIPEYVKINTPEERYASHIISVRLPSIKSETMLHFLSKEGVCVSSGSACSSNGKHKNSSLSSFGLTEKEADSTIRISLSLYNTEDDLLKTAELIKKGCESLARI